MAQGPPIFPPMPAPPAPQPSGDVRVAGAARQLAVLPGRPPADLSQLAQGQQPTMQGQYPAQAPPSAAAVPSRFVDFPMPGGQTHTMEIKSPEEEYGPQGSLRQWWLRPGGQAPTNRTIDPSSMAGILLPMADGTTGLRQLLPGADGQVREIIHRNAQLPPGYTPNQALASMPNPAAAYQDLLQKKLTNTGASQQAAGMVGAAAGNPLAALAGGLAPQQQPGTAGMLNALGALQSYGGQDAQARANEQAKELSLIGAGKDISVADIGAHSVRNAALIGLYQKMQEAGLSGERIQAGFNAIPGLVSGAVGSLGASLPFLSKYFGGGQAGGGLPGVPEPVTGGVPLPGVPAPGATAAAGGAGQTTQPNQGLVADQKQQVVDQILDKIVPKGTSGTRTLNKDEVTNAIAKTTVAQNDPAMMQQIVQKVLDAGVIDQGALQKFLQNEMIRYGRETNLDRTNPQSAVTFGNYTVQNQMSPWTQTARVLNPQGEELFHRWNMEAIPGLGALLAAGQGTGDVLPTWKDPTIQNYTARGNATAMWLDALKDINLAKQAAGK